MTTTKKLINKITNTINNEKEYTRNELDKLLTQVFVSNQGGIVNSKIRMKREPSSYNQFVKEQLPLIKNEFPQLSRQDLMRKVGEEWKKNKEKLSPKSPKSPKSIKRMLEKNYPELDSIQKKRLLDNLLKTSIYWKT